MTENIVLTNGTVWLYKDNKYEPVSGFNVFINRETGRISKVTGDIDFSDYKAIDVKGHHIVPGAIDTHCHGISNKTVGNITAGVWNTKNKRFYGNKSIIREVYEESCLLMAQHGTTSWIPTTMAASQRKLQRSLETMVACINDKPTGAEILGAGIEGSFLYRDSRFTGCLNPHYFHHPSVSKYQQLIEDVAKDYVKWVAVGPRYENALELVQYLSENNILVGIGHSGASKESVLEVLRKIGQVGTGGMFYIHLYNGPIGSNFKRRFGKVQQAVGPSIIEARDKGIQLHAELILDSEHVSEPISREALANFGKGYTLAVTDNIGVGPKSQVEWFRIGGKNARVSRSHPKAIWGKGGESLFGSRATTMDQMLSYILDILDGYPLYTENSTQEVFDHALSFEEKMDYALHMLCRAPANMYGLSNKKGILENGYDADIVVLDITGESGVEVREVFTRGEEIDMEAKPL